MKQLSIYTFLFVNLILFGFADAVETIKDGPWNDSSVWKSSKVPVEGDTVTIKHKVEIKESSVVGASPKTKEAAPAIQIEYGAELTLTKTQLSVYGSIINKGTLKVLTGGKLEINATKAPKEINYSIAIAPLYAKKAEFILEGSASSPAQLMSNPINRASIMDGYRWKDDYLFPEKGGVLTTKHAVITGFGDAKDPCWQYSQVNDQVISLKKTLFKNCGIIINRGSAKIKLTFEEVKWEDSVPLSKEAVGRGKGLFVTSAGDGSVCSVKYCDFDERVSLSKCNGYTIEDSIFRKGVVRYSGKWNEGSMASFKRNIVIWPEKYNKGGIRLPYGESYEDCFFIQDYTSHNNPHYMSVSGKAGVAKLVGSIFWFSGPNEVSFGPEGDGPMPGDAASGDRSTNKFIVEHCIFMPNGIKGPEQARNLTANITSGVFPAKNVSVIVRRNTAFSGGGPGGVCYGETHTTPEGAIEYVKSNLFVGSPAMDGQKMHDFGHGVANVIKAENCDYNAGFRLKDGSNYIKGKTGKGYSKLILKGNKNIGANDLDNVDPKFVDPNRNPLTWAKEHDKKADLQEALNLIKPTGKKSIADLLAYIREGFRPTNKKLKGAGDPEAGSPDIGAVDLH